ncbi:thioredoxin 1 [Wigglesworthia glossinidia endosymbiont of Glossina morsitans morsitans (Yale colony)]|uniref:Thioredoxin n=1 Tax=Wigglesworthia glossinidia endosymbiont of Glossina morsitans morsitans (Yale colony) TaxID=1142511 RepID=H6Q513_WIGGL|nr:thioredoxin [Wigglesworthia glossinidia]AFA41296.1 thioredoxin 1 [Wigglesworthia glossinidia endosymbiont of Glossina morsitans morsitans (Yale colony)]
MDYQDNIQEINDNDFNIVVLQSKSPVLVDFWAEWCSPCKSMIPILQDISKKYVKKLKLVKINIEKNAIIQEKYLIRSIPTLLLFFNQNLLGTKIGVSSQKELEFFIDSYLKKL